MTKRTIVAQSFALAATLAGCQKQAEAPAPVPNTSVMSSRMGNMLTAGATNHGQATGTVTAIDAANGTITRDHGPMTGLDWPAIKMAFTTMLEQIAGLKVGDTIAFETN